VRVTRSVTGTIGSSGAGAANIFPLGRFPHGVVEVDKIGCGKTNWFGAKIVIHGGQFCCPFCMVADGLSSANGGYIIEETPVRIRFLFRGAICQLAKTGFGPPTPPPPPGC